MIPYLGEDAPISTSQMWVLLGLAIMGLVYVLVLRPMTRRKKDPLERPPAFASLSQQRSVERQMQNLLVELSEMARQLTAQLDTRAARLESLIREADQKITILRGGENPSSEIPVQTPAEPVAEAEQVPDPRHADIYALADQGRDSGEIASQLGRPRGEVELILALRSRS